MRVVCINVVVWVAVLCMSGESVFAQTDSYYKSLSNGGEVNGPRSIKNIEDNIALLLPRLEHFFKKRLRINPDLNGTIEMVLDIDAKGNVLYSSVGLSTTNDADFNDEILHAVHLHKFGVWKKGRGKTEVIYPFFFSKERVGPGQRVSRKDRGNVSEEKPDGKEKQRPQELQTPQQEEAEAGGTTPAKDDERDTDDE